MNRKEDPSSFVSQVHKLKQSLEQSLDQQFAPLMAEAEARSRMEIKIAELTAAEAKLREELESAVDHAEEQKLQLKRIMRESSADRAQALQKHEKIESELRAEIEGLKNQLAIAIQEKEEFSEFFQYTERSLKEKIASLESENTKIRFATETAEAAKAQLETEFRRKLALIADEKWGLELQVTQLKKDLELQAAAAQPVDKSSFDSLQESYEAAQEEMGSLRAQILKAQSDLKKAQVAAEKAEAGLKTNADRLAHSAEIEQASCAEIVRLTDLLEKAVTERDSSRLKEAKAKTDLVQTQSRIQRLTEDLAKAESMISEKEDQIESWLRSRPQAPFRTSN